MSEATIQPGHERSEARSDKQPSSTTRTRFLDSNPEGR